MSFPPRHPMTLPGMPPMPPGMLPPGYSMPPMAPMMPLGVMAAPVRLYSLINSAVEDSMVNMIDTYTILPPGMTMGHIPDTRGLMQNHRMPVGKKPPHHMPPGALGRKPQTQRWTPMSFNTNKNDERRDAGPTITVFVGNITDRASDNMIKHILQRCGCVVSWKRVQGASGKLQAFGFCEYADPESGLRAIRLLHDWEIGDRKLVVKVDAKTKAQLDEYKAAKKAKKAKDGGTVPEVENIDEVDEDTQREDRVARAGIDAIIREHEHELSRPSLSDSPKKSKLSKAQEALLKISGQTGNGEGGTAGGEGKEGKDNLDEMDIEEDKKNLIHREIGKFRDTMKKLEEEKERERERRERDRERREKERDRDRDRTERREKESNRLRSKTPDRPREKVVREISRERSYERSRSRSRERERSKERERSRERSREVEYDKTKRDKDIEREREEEEEAYERKKLERKLREKEAAYQERLRNWEARERKKSREYDKEKEKEEERRSEEHNVATRWRSNSLSSSFSTGTAGKEAKRLKEFLEDYDDDRDDPKYYKGSALNRRLKEREKEMEIDSRDRQREKEELEELKQKLLEEGHPDPSGEFERIKREREEQFRPKIKIELPVEDEKENITVVNLKMKPVVSSPAPEPEPPTIKAKLRAIELDDTTQNSLSGFSDITTPKEEVKQKPLGFTGLKLGSSPNQHQQSSGKRKKIPLGEVFNQDEDDSSDSQPRKRKLVPLDYTDEEKKAVTQPTTAAAAAAAAAAATSTSQEEKRKHIKNLIDKIPTEKDKLFAYNIDWSIVDNVLMEKRIKPWINKKIVEYIGEEEPTLVDFICSKVMAGSTPQCVLDDVQMVLDEEAEVFVVKMWRLLIYEIEAKKLGIMK